MTRFITIFSLFAGTCSVLGILVPAITGVSIVPPSILIPAFLLISILSAYILFVPNTRIERNVRSKLERYAAPRNPSDTDAPVLIQRGAFRLGFKYKTSVEFQHPYAVAQHVADKEGMYFVPYGILTNDKIRRSEIA